MTQELLERTVRDWVHTNPRRGARELARFASNAASNAVRSVDDIAEGLILVAGRMRVASSRAW